MSTNTELETLDIASPGGAWNDLHPTRGRQIRACLKKQFLIKLRHPASIIEFFVAFVIVGLIYLVYALAVTTTDEIANPEEEMVNYTYPLMAFYFMPNKDNPPKVFLWPENDRTKYLIEYNNNNPMANILATYIKMMGVQTKFVKDLSEMEEDTYGSDSLTLGINWINSDKTENDECWYSPEIHLYYQSLSVSIQNEVLHSLRTAIAYKIYEMEPNPLKKAKSLLLATTQFGFTYYATPKITVYYDINMAVAIFAVLPIIFSTMPDFQTLFEEKDSRISGLSFLMGCSEATYWFVIFFTTFVLSLFPYILLGILLCFCFGMVGTNFGLYLVLMLLYLFSEIFFQLFITTFMKKGTSGRALTVVLLIFMVFFAMLHSFFTLDETQSSQAIKHLFSIIPFSALQLFLMSGYTRCNQGLSPYTFNTTGDDVTYAPWIALLWLAIDSVLYFALFVIFNATNPRNFGTPIIAWREIFSKAAWKRLFISSEAKEAARIAPITDRFLEVHNLKKVYHSTKDIVAINDVDFHIDSNEVIVIIGPNGAGKSTLCNILAGATEPTSGFLKLLGGEETTRFIEVQKYLGICLQENILIDLLSVKEHFELFGAFRGVSEHYLQKSIEFFAEQLQLGEMLDNRAGDLSGGQKRKLCIALSLLGDPPLIIMDEPTAGVDVQARQLIWKMIASLSGTTTIVTSHALEEAEAVSSRLFIMSAGKIEFSGSSTELRQQFKCGYLLRVQRQDGTVGPVLELAQQFIPDAKLTEERKDTIMMPVSDKIPLFLRTLASKDQEYGVESYSFSVEQLEDMLMKIIQTGEAAAQ